MSSYLSTVINPQGQFKHYFCFPNIPVLNLETQLPKKFGLACERFARQPQG